MQDTRRDGITVPKWTIGILLTVLAWAGSAYVGYAAADKQFSVRLSVVEEQYRQLHEDMKALKDDLRALLRRP